MGQKHSTKRRNKEEKSKENKALESELKKDEQLSGCEIRNVVCKNFFIF